MRQGNPVRGYVYAWGELCLDCWEGSIADAAASVSGEEGRPVYQDGAEERHVCSACYDVYIGPVTLEDLDTMRARDAATPDA